ncbi:MAG: FumA C-terminus/TtdB family hydratase beta subunit [Chloroflexota bacterium]|nr:FumA C-terminus/TtdB family hydratase beta subunit [Chloroflexota bacterium]
MQKINVPLTEDVIRNLRVGDTVALSGVMITGRDTVHKWMIDTFINNTRQPSGDDLEVYEAIKPLLKNGVIYHCGPVVSGLESGDYQFVAAGPTTSIREEPYQGDVMRHFTIRAVIGKGGMKAKTLNTCQEIGGVYLHAIGGAASLIAQSVVSVLDVYKLDFGVPEAIWVIDVKDFPAVVTMDANGNSLHTEIENNSKQVLDKLLAQA